MHLLLFILAIWVLLALAGLPTNNLEFACPDLTAWTEVDPSAEDQLSSRSRRISRSFILSSPAREILSFSSWVLIFCTMYSLLLYFLVM